MDGNAFDTVIRDLATRLSRRSLCGAAAGAALGIVAARTPFAEARKRNRKKKRKPLQQNAFGCVDVGKACRGNSDNCCSGICDGEAPKKGKQDRSTCVAHNAGACLAGQHSCAADESPCGMDALCFRTTGKASFCGANNGGECRLCQKDTECEADFGPGAACVVCEGCDEFDTACVVASV